MAGDKQTEAAPAASVSESNAAYGVNVMYHVVAK